MTKLTVFAFTAALLLGGQTSAAEGTLKGEVKGAVQPAARPQPAPRDTTGTAKRWQAASSNSGRRIVIIHGVQY